MAPARLVVVLALVVFCQFADGARTNVVVQEHNIEESQVKQLQEEQHGDPEEDLADNDGEKGDDYEFDDKLEIDFGEYGDEENSAALNLTTLQCGALGEALIPMLVVPKGKTYHFINREKKFYEKEHMIMDKHAYSWEFDGKQIADLAGSRATMHDTTVVKDNAGNDVMTIKAKHIMQMHASYVIMPPGTDDKHKALFTATQKLLGRGFLWKLRQWKIYRGYQSEMFWADTKETLYYVIGSYFGKKFRFYKKESDYEENKPHVAEIRQVKNLGHFISGSFFPDKWVLSVQEDQDAGLVLAVATVFDLFFDLEERLKRSLKKH